MAHVKVIRRSMRPEEYNELRVSFLKRRVYTELCEVAPVMSVAVGLRLTPCPSAGGSAPK